MKLRFKLLIAGVLAFCLAAPAIADLTYTQGSGTTIFDFVCFTTKHCPAHVNVDSTGTEISMATSTLQTSANTKLDTIITNTGAAIPAGTAIIGKVGIDQTTPGTTNGVQVNAGTASIGAVGSDPSLGKATPTFANLALPATTTTQIIALSGTTVTYVTSLHFMASGAVNITLKYGTGSNCGTGTTTLAGPYPLAAQAGMAIGSGTGAILIVPAGKALCVTTDASMTGAVGLTYQQF